MYILFPIVVFIIAYGIVIMPNKMKHNVLYCAFAVLLVYKIIEYAIMITQTGLSKIPVEFSAVSYFLLSIVVVFKIHKLKFVAAFSGFISGLLYILSFVFIAENTIALNGVVLTLVAMLNHSILFWGSLVIIGDIKATKKDIKYIYIYIFVYMAYAEFVLLVLKPTQPDLLIRTILSWDLVHFFYPDIVFGLHSLPIYILYVLFVYGMIRLVLWIFMEINKRFYNPHVSTT
jgi:hypothetical protein